MVLEMERKNLELKRITKTATLLIMSGLSPNSIPARIPLKVIASQKNDGGWISILDTLWNIAFLKKLDYERYKVSIQLGLEFLSQNRNNSDLWGRSSRDIARIPVSGILLFLLPELAGERELTKLESLWTSEINSLVYKAGYTLMAFKANEYIPTNSQIIENTVKWLLKSQRPDGGFAPWKDHPVDSNVFCTSIAVLGLIQYPQYEDIIALNKAYTWLQTSRIKSGIWKYHEIEDGASWGLYTLLELSKRL